MKIKALLFDFDETLLINEKSTRESVRAAWHMVESDYPNIDVEQVVETYMDVRDKFWHVPDDQVIPVIQKGMLYTRNVLWIKTLQTLDISYEKMLPILVEKFGHKRFETWKLYPESREVLDLLKKSYKLVMITNGIPEVQRRKIQKTDVESYFHPILISGEIGISKPDAQFFYKAADEIHTKYEECIVIGDSVRNDIGGAKNAGMLSVWVNRYGSTHPDITPGFEIKNLHELPLILNNLG